jgi:hypothetical protein
MAGYSNGVDCGVDWIAGRSLTSIEIRDQASYALPNLVADGSDRLDRLAFWVGEVPVDLSLAGM